jgi:poly-beta-1,6-N-acetyl-D-glucosamine synthase
MNLAYFTFWFGDFIIVYTYAGYACLMLLLVSVKKLLSSKKTATISDFEPEVTLVIPCYNEKEVLATKVENSFQLDYPKNKLHIIFITDGSTDGSEIFLKTFAGITNLHSEKREGKAMAENRSMQFVKTPFVIFCDANTQLNKEAVRKMIRHYQDSTVGAVAGEKRIVSNSKDSASAAGEGIYWKYESLLKRLDSELHSTIGGAGELISIRCSLYSNLEPDTILDDFMQSMRIALNGYKVAYEPNAFAEETASVNVNEEIKRKIRISAGAWQSMFRLGKAFNPFHDFGLTFMFVSHKVLRWTLAPIFLLLVMPANIFLSINEGGWYTVFIYLQLAFYVLAFLGWVVENYQIRIKILFIPYYFFMTNLCMFLGFWRFAQGKQSVKWERVERS